MNSVIKDLIIGLLFTAVLLTSHVGVQQLIPEKFHFDSWALVYVSQFLIYSLLFIALKGVSKFDENRVGQVFIIIATFRIIFVGLILVVYKKYVEIDIVPFALHFTVVALLYIGFETYRTFKKYLS